ncbi:MAG TPA: lysophospholipid transporter LplT [Burkholderiaceae bacterium]|nr:lysophospholipid transporter LplT [Burkholderiaceae bacterium]
MNRGFYTVMAAQFFSSLADNAMLIAAFELLQELHASDAMRPMLKLFFFISYVVLAAFVGAFADSMPKGRVMFLTNGIKLAGGALMLVGIHPLFAYAVIGFGAAAYSPAKYGIVTEMLPPEKLVAANGWIETLTVASIVLGSFVGGVLVSARVSALLGSLGAPLHKGIELSVSETAIGVICLLYGVAALLNLGIPDTGVRYAPQKLSPVDMMKNFAHCVRTLWTDKLGQISLAVTTLFWGAGATLQILVIAWSQHALRMGLSRAAILQSVTAIGVAAGAIGAAGRVRLRQSFSVLPYGVAMGLVVVLIAVIDFRVFPPGGVSFGTIDIGWATLAAAILMMLVGALAGYFIVPMNALLQHRGYVLLSAGNSIAVQNFNENLGILVMAGIYTLLIVSGISIRTTMVSFGVFVAGAMALVIWRHNSNQKQFDSLALIGDTHHGGGEPQA